MKTLFQFLLKLHNILQFNWLYIILSLLMPLSLYYVGQGQELMKVLHEQEQRFNIFLIFSGFALLFYAIWVIPFYSIYVLNVVNKISSLMAGPKYKPILPNEGLALYKDTVSVNNNATMNNNDKVIAIRHFASLPIISFHFVFALGHHQDDIFQRICVYSIWISMYFLLFHMTKKIFKLLTQKKYQKLHFINNHPLWSGYAFLFILTLLLSYLWSNSFLNQVICHLLIVGLLVFNNSLHYYIEEEFRLEKEEALIQQQFDHGNKRYRLTLMSVGFMIVLFYTCSKYMLLHLVHPVAIGTCLISMYILILDLIFSTSRIMASLIVRGNNEEQEKVYASIPINLSLFNFCLLTLALLLSVVGLFSLGTRHTFRHDTPLQSTDLLKRDSLNQYFTQWKKENKLSNTDTIILIAGQGGGSRAGAWMFSNLTILDRLYSKQIFALSTVSGSSNGANNFIFKKYLDLYSNKVNNDATMLNKLYNYNYLSQSFWGLLLKDGLFGKLFFQKSRNYFHEEDEINALSSAYNPKRDAALNTSIHKLIKEDFIAKYSGPFKYNLPLLFTNSASTQAGKRVVFSPIICDPLLFTTALDGYGVFKQTYSDKALLSHSAVNASQSFPFTSAYTYLDRLGNLIDGGLYDNTGANTLMEIYLSLNPHCSYAELSF